MYNIYTYIIHISTRQILLPGPIIKIIVDYIDLNRPLETQPFASSAQAFASLFGSASGLFRHEALKLLVARQVIHGPAKNLGVSNGGQLERIVIWLYQCWWHG